MKPWNSVRREVVGAWRSVRYDLDHRSKAGVESEAGVESKAGVEPKATIDPDATAVLSRVRPERESIWSPLRDPRRMMATVAVAGLVTASATGTFFAVTGGLGILLVNSPGAPAAPQTAPPSAPHVVASPTALPRQIPASRRPSPSASSSGRVSPTPARPAGPRRPSPSVAATTIAPSRSPTPESTPSTTVSSTPSPIATPSAAAAP